MTNAILRGKPDGGTSHIRFYEGEVASAKPRRGVQLYKNLIVGCIAGLAAVVSLTAVADDYYWTGAAGDDVFITKGNWALADGTPATAKPGATTMVIFTNDVPLKISWTAAATLYGCRFHGADVEASASSSTCNFTLGAGGVVADGGGTYQLGWHLSFTADEDHVIDVAAGSTFVCVRQLTASPNSRVTKRGAGTFQTKDSSAYFRFEGALTLEEGLVYDAGNNSTYRDSLPLSVCVSGPAAKTFYVFGHKSGSNAGFGTTGHFSIAEGAEDSVFKIAFETSVARVFKIYGDQTDTIFNADLVNQGSSAEGERTFLWAPNDASTTLTYIRKTLDSTKWGVAVTNGIMKFADGMRVEQLRQVWIQRDGKLVIDPTAGSGLLGAPLAITDNGMFSVSGDRQFFSLPSVTVDGVAVPDGFYDEDDLDWYEGDAILVIGTPAEPETTAATWVGGEAGNSIFAEANWGGTLPNLTSGSLVATFPADAQVVVPSGTAVWLKGIQVQDGTSDQTLSVSGQGVLRLGSEGVKTKTLTGKGKLSFGGEILFMFDQSWQVGVANAITFETTARLRSVPGVVWTSRGAAEGTTSGTGAMRICCSNPDLGDSVLYHAVTVEADAALGGKDAYATVSGVNRPKVTLTMVDCTLVNDRLRVGDVNNSSQNYSLMAQSGVCTILGEADMYTSNYDYWACEKGAVLNFRGGLKSRRTMNVGRTFISRLDGYVVHVSDVPTDMVKLSLSNAGAFYLDVADNSIYRGVHLNDADAVLHTTVPNALKRGNSDSADHVSAVKFAASGRWELHDCDQEVQILCGTSPGVVYSQNDAVIRLHDDAVYTQEKSGDEKGGCLTGDGQYVESCIFAGGAGLVKDGPLTHTCCGVSTSTGRVEVANGNLVFATGASWKNASAVKVSGMGVLTVPDGKVFGRGAAMTIDTAEGASVEIPAGQILRVASLTVDGTPVKGAYKGAGVTGGGEIFAGKPGLVLVVQ